MKTFVKSVFVFVASFLIVIGVIAFSVRLRLEDSNAYLNAIEKSGLYEIIEKPSDLLISESEPVKDLADQISQNLELKSTTRDFFENNSRNVTNWFKGEDLYFYFPKQQIVEKLNSKSFREDTYIGIDEAFESLPQCSSEEIFEIEDKVNREEFFIPSCRPQESDQIYKIQKDEFEKRIEELLEDETTIYKILEETGLDKYDESTSFSEVLTDIDDPIARQNLEERIETAEYVLEISKLLPFGILSVGIVLLFFATLLAQKKLKFFSGVLFVNSLFIVCAFSLILISSNLGIDFAESRVITENGQDFSRIINMVSKLLKSFVYNLTTPLIIFFALVSFVLGVLRYLVRKIGTNQ